MTRMAAVLVSLFLLVGCAGGAEDQATGETESPEATDGVAAPEAEEPATEGEDAATEAATESSALEGETVEFVVPYEPGGGYDQYARLIAPYLADCIGADVVVINEPGAGSLLATNQTAVADPDGTRIQIVNTIGAGGAQIAEAEGVNFDLNEMSWIARVAASPDVVSVAPDSEFQTFQDMLDADRPIRFVSTGPGSDDYVTPTLLSEVFGFEIELITGFAGSGELQTAVVRGDGDAHVLFLDSAYPYIEAGELRPLVLVGSPSELAPDTPTTDEFEPIDEASQAILDSYIALVETGRSIAGPPGLPEDVLTTLREGFDCALSNEELLTQAEEISRPIAYLPGEETAELVRAATAESPEAFRDLIRRTFP